MPKVTIWIRVDDLDKWDAIDSKPEFIHNALNPEIDDDLKDLPEANIDNVTASGKTMDDLATLDYSQVDSSTNSTTGEVKPEPGTSAWVTKTVNEAITKPIKTPNGDQSGDKSKMAAGIATLKTPKAVEKGWAGSNFKKGKKS